MKAGDFSGMDRYIYEMMEDLTASIKDCADTDDDVADFAIELFCLNEVNIKEKKRFGKAIQSCLTKYF